MDPPDPGLTVPWWVQHNGRPIKVSSSCWSGKPVNFFMNKFKKLGFIEYDGDLDAAPGSSAPRRTR
jgi:hypothetical protein